MFFEQCCYQDDGVYKVVTNQSYKINEPSAGIESGKPVKRLGGAYFSRVGAERPNAVW